jgi:hypothetical protein
MGDRANIYLRDSDDTSGMYLYTHNGGWAWPQRLQEALRFGESRWDDPAYLARIIDSRVFADLVHDTTGGGLSTELADDGNYPVLCVDLIGQRVGLCAAVKYVCADCGQPVDEDHFDNDHWPDTESTMNVDLHDMSNWVNVLLFKEFCDIDQVSFGLLVSLQQDTAKS